MRERLETASHRVVLDMGDAGLALVALGRCYAAAIQNAKRAKPHVLQGQTLASRRWRAIWQTWEWRPFGGGYWETRCDVSRAIGPLWKRATLTVVESSVADEASTAAAEYRRRKGPSKAAAEYARVIDRTLGRAGKIGGSQ